MSKHWKHWVNASQLLKSLVLLVQSKVRLVRQIAVIHDTNVMDESHRCLQDEIRGSTMAVAGLWAHGYRTGRHRLLQDVRVVQLRAPLVGVLLRPQHAQVDHGVCVVQVLLGLAPRGNAVRLPRRHVRRGVRLPALIVLVRTSYVSGRHLALLGLATLVEP